MRPEPTAERKNRKEQQMEPTETPLGQMAPPKSGHPLRTPPESGGILRGGPLLGGAICPDVVCSSASTRMQREVHALILILYDKAFQLKLSGNEVYHTNSSILLGKNMLCSKLHYQKGFDSILCSHHISRNVFLRLFC